jgi:hypothetical protein
MNLSRFIQQLGRAGLVMAATIGFAAGEASAADTNFAVNANPRIITPGVLAVLDLNGPAAGIDLIVGVPATSEISIFFNAECTVDAPTDLVYLAVDILVDGVLIPPTGIDRAFCTATGDNALQHWVSAEANVYRIVAAGNHVVRVRAQLVNEAGGDTARIDDTTIIVIETP